MNIKKIEAIGLAKRLLELEDKLVQLKEVEKEVNQIKNRLKELFPDGYVGVEEGILLEVKKSKYVQYDVPQEIKEQYKVESHRYSVFVKKIK